MLTDAYAITPDVSYLIPKYFIEFASLPEAMILRTHSLASREFQDLDFCVGNMTVLVTFA